MVIMVVVGDDGSGGDGECDDGSGSSNFDDDGDGDK